MSMTKHSAVFVLAATILFPAANSPATPGTPALQGTVAADQKTTSRDSADRDRLNTSLANRLAGMQKSGQLIGLAVHDRDDHKLGKIEDLILDLGSGRVLGVLVTSSGGDCLVVVPGKSFLAIDKSRAVLNSDRQTFSAAPRLTKATDNPATLAKSITTAYACFSQPVWLSPTDPQKISKSSRLIGMPVKNKANEDLGNLVDLMVDLPTDRIFFAVISLDKTNHGLVALPPASLRVNELKTILTLDAGKASMAKAARHGDSLWMEMTDPGWVAATYRLHGQELAYEGGADNRAPDPTRENVRTKVDNASAPAPAGKAAGLTDAEITKSILTAMIREDLGNGFSYKQMKIITVNGQVTLQGKVKSGKQKEAIGIASASVVGSGNVNNQLEARK